MQDIYVLLKDIKKISINLEERCKFIYLPAENQTVKYKFFGLLRKLVPPKPERWLRMYGDTIEETISKYDHSSKYMIRDELKEKDGYRIDETTKEVYRMATVNLEMEDGRWVTYKRCQSNVEAEATAIWIKNQSSKIFV
jgi:hypothetical protein